MRRVLLNPKALIIAFGIAIFACGDSGPTAVGGDTQDEPTLEKLVFSGAMISEGDTIIHVIPDATMASPPIAIVWVKDWPDPGLWGRWPEFTLRESGSDLQAAIVPWRRTDSASTEYRLTVIY